MSIYRLGERIDSANAAKFEEDISGFIEKEAPSDLVLDAADLGYISSAGLRVLLKIKKSGMPLKVVNVSTQVYEIFEMTGFNEIIETEKALRKISIEGCPEIGRGAHGVVYRIAPDTVVKVYNPGTEIADVQKERELSRWAFVNDLPTAIPYDVVLVGEQYGAVFELLNAVSSAEFIAESEENFDRFIAESVGLMKQIHSVEVEPGKLPDMKEKTRSWAEDLKDLLDEDVWQGVMKLIDEVPESHTLLHADYHLKNLMFCDGSLMIIDMDTLSVGDPIFELATVYNSYREFPSIAAEAAAFLGIDIETANRICDRTFAGYLGDVSESERKTIEKKARILGCVRIIEFMKRKGEEGVKQFVIDRCVSDITEQWRIL